ncbi:hypothetical protein [Thalassotalea eurytherma]|uniref:Uncharacterized protein n=1 Tax=Thalassotalea eurytherma TaxID=1144278 RepID=A0ABQ6H086_9GAMM|nr:hypothetical protein [Thalassotalea eurytherma]GLX80989.1 hypothetical protein theurythT_04410 [Thalassotalea eurytherma]
MKLDDLKQDWQEIVDVPADNENLEKVIAMLEHETKKVDKEIKRRDILEITIALLLIPFWVFGLFYSAGIIQSIGLILAILNSIYIPYRLVSAKKINVSKESSIRSYLENEKQKISQQKSLLEGVVSWYIAPITVSIILITLGASVDASGIPQLSESLMIYYGFLTILIVAVYFLNKRAVTKKFNPLLSSIDKKLQELKEAD